MTSTSSKGIIHGAAGFVDGRDSDPDIGDIKSTNLFERGIVIDTICDVSIRDTPPSSLLESQKELFSLAPRNSIVCRIMSSGDPTSNTGDIVCFPFFSSHLALPVKAGEQVWVFRQSPMRDWDVGQSYWVCRISDVLSVEDTNFAPFTRPHRIEQSGTMAPERVLDFSSGDSNTQVSESDLLSFIKNSIEVKHVVMEPVPRLTKRPGDLSFQGSNNTSITLGTDRGWDASSRPGKSKNSNAQEENSPGENAGSIDVVAGRGRYFNSNDSEIKRDRSSGMSIANSTQPLIAQNSFGKFETDKEPGQAQPLGEKKEQGNIALPTPGNAKTNPTEGDPDFLVDASRIYVSSNTNIDSRLGLDKIVAKGFEKQSEPKSGASIAVKSDHIRIVARKLPLQSASGNLPEKFESATGSIRIVKEGNPNEDLATITIEEDGTIQISGTKLFLGRAPADGGDGTGPGPGQSQPYIKYKQLEDLWKETMDTLITFCDTVLTHVTPGYGSPSPQLNQAAAELKSKIAGKLKIDIETLKSKRIFGE